MNFLSKLSFYFEKPKVIIITGAGRKMVGEVISQILKPYFKIGGEILILEAEVKNYQDFNFLIKYSQLPILVFTNQEGDNIEGIFKLAKTFPSKGYLILNSDDEKIKEIITCLRQNLNSSLCPELKNLPDLNILTFGFQERADFRVTDVKLNGGINFKLNYQGNVVPFWLDYLSNKEGIYSVLAAISIGTLFNLNLIEISQILKNYKFIS